MSSFQQDVIQGLGRIDPGTMSWWPQPNPTDLGRANSGPARAQEICVTTSPLFGSIPERTYTMVPLTSFKWRTNQLGKIPALLRQPTQTVSATVSGVKLTSPIAPPDWAEEEKWYVLVVTTSIRSLNLEMTGVILGDMVTALPGGSAFWNQPMAAVLSRPI